MRSLLLALLLLLPLTARAQTMPEPADDSSAAPAPAAEADAAESDWPPLPEAVPPDLPDGKVPADWNGDVVATTTVAASPAVVQAFVSDLRNQQALLARCTKDWEHGSKHVGVGANAVLVYKIGPFRRKLSATISEIVPDRRVTVDHPGNKGFVTAWDTTVVDGATQVELHTWLTLPVKPFRKVYVRKVQPQWTACYQGALMALAAELDGTAP